MMQVRRNSTGIFNNGSRTRHLRGLATCSHTLYGCTAGVGYDPDRFAKSPGLYLYHVALEDLRGTSSHSQSGGQALEGFFVAEHHHLLNGNYNNNGQWSHPEPPGLSIPAKKRGKLRECVKKRPSSGSSSDCVSTDDLMKIGPVPLSSISLDLSRRIYNIAKNSPSGHFVTFSNIKSKSGHSVRRNVEKKSPSVQSVTLADLVESHSVHGASAESISRGSNASQNVAVEKKNRDPEPISYEMKDPFLRHDVASNTSSWLLTNAACTMEKNHHPEGVKPYDVQSFKSTREVAVNTSSQRLLSSADVVEKHHPDEIRPPLNLYKCFQIKSYEDKFNTSTWPDYSPVLEKSQSRKTVPTDVSLAKDSELFRACNKPVDSILPEAPGKPDRVVDADYSPQAGALTVNLPSPSAFVRYLGVREHPPLSPRGHERPCQDRWRQRNDELPKRLCCFEPREPSTIQEMTGGIKGLSKGQYNLANFATLDSALAPYVRCDECGEAFLPD